MDRNQKFNHCTQGDFCGVKANGYFFSDKVDRRLPDSTVQLVEVFEQPDARNAVDGGDVKCEPCNIPLEEIIHLLFYLLLIQKSIFPVMNMILHSDTGGVFEGIILIKFMVVQQLVNLFASDAAEFLSAINNGLFTTVGTAMYTRVVCHALRIITVTRSQFAIFVHFVIQQHFSAITILLLSLADSRSV
jgi:hypothetical protein